MRVIPDSGSSPSRDPEHFSGSRLGILPLQEPPTQDPEGWIPTRAGSPLGNQESVLQEISFSRQQPAARQGAQPSTSNVQPAGRRPLLGGVLRRCTPGGLPEIRGVLPRRRASSRTPLASWAPPNCHLGTSFLLAVPSFLLGVLRVTFLAAAAQLMRVSSGGLPEIRGVLRSVLVGANNHRGSAIKLL